MDLDALERLVNLRNSGVLTQEEYDTQKQKLLSNGAREVREAPIGAGRNRNSLFLLAIAVFVAAAILLWFLFSSLDGQPAPNEPVGTGSLPQAPITSLPVAKKEIATGEKAVPVVQSGCTGYYLYLGTGTHDDAFSVEVSADTVRVQWLDYSNAYGPRMTMPGGSVEFVDAQDSRRWALKCRGKNAEIFSPEGKTYQLQKSAEDVFSVASERWGWVPGE